MMSEKDIERGIITDDGKSNRPYREDRWGENSEGSSVDIQRAEEEFQEYGSLSDDSMTYL